MEDKNSNHTDNISNVGKEKEQNMNSERDLNYGTRQIQYVIKDLTEATKTWGSKITELESTIIKLQDESFILSKVPEEMKTRLDKLVPHISASILNILDKKLLQNFNETIEQCKSRINELGRKAQDIKGELDSSEGRNFRKKMLMFGLSVACSSLITLSVCYYGMQKFPQYLRIDHKGDLHIDHGKVLIWGHDEGKEKSKSPRK